MSVTAYIALGSNLENPGYQLQRAVDNIDSEKNINLLCCSKLYQSDPVGPAGQPDYCNAVVSIETRLAPELLLDTLQAIEDKHGRVRAVKWGARTLDLDIILYGDHIINTPRLTIPHQQMHVRSFVLYPLHDLAPELMVPEYGAVSGLLNNVDANGVQQIAESWPWY